MKLRRLAFVPVTMELLIDMMIEGRVTPPTRCIKGLPEDAVYMHSFQDSASGCVCFVFTHPSFPEARVGDRITQFDVQLQKLEPPRLIHSTS